MQETAITSNLPQQPRRRKFLRYTFIGFGAFILFVLFSAILIPLLFEGQVKKIFLKEINKNLATEIVVDEDDIELSILKNFPEATVVFRNVAIRESIKNSKENFLHSDAISLLFNVRDILKGNYVIKKIIVQDADIRLLTDAQGNINYKFWKENESEDSSGDLSVVLEEVKCENINFIYADKKNRQDISMLIKDVTMHGNFTADTYTLKTEGDILSHGIEIRNTKYLIEKELKINTALDVNNVTDTYTFKKGVITVNKNIFEIEGSITDATELALDLEVKSSKADVEALMLLLPGNYASALKNIESKGKITFQSVIEGTYTKQKNPAVTIDFNIDDGTIYHKDFGGRLTDVNCSGTYSNGEKHAAQTSSLKINNLSAKYGKEPVSFKLIYNNFTNPFIDLQLNGNIPASILIASVAENITDAEGYIAFDNVSVKGQIKNFRSDLATEPVQGNFSFHDVACTINKEKIKINGTAQLENAEMILDNFKAEFFGSVLQASITLNNWLETIFISGSENKPPLNISGNISCDKFDLQKTIATFTSPEKQPVPASPGNITTKKQATNDWMNVSGNIRCAIDDFQYKKLQVKNVKADLKLSPGFIGVNNFTGNSMNGNFNVQTTFRKLASENYLLEIIGILNTIDIQQLFIQLNNFEQTTLTDKNLSGKATAYIENVSIQWDKNYKLIEKNMYALVNVKIENGELINYKPLESLSKFVNIEDLKHIRFSTLQNQIEIKDRVITIPAMDIQTSALDIYVSGTHSFDNTIDYQMQLSLAELMAKKFFGKNKNKDNYENDTQGGINIYVSMTGTVEKPVIQYNKKQVKEKMQDQGIDKPDFLDIFKPDDPKEKHDLFKPKDNKHETDEDEPIEFIEWEDE